MPMTDWDRAYFASDRFRALNKAIDEMPKEEPGMRQEVEELITKLAKVAGDAMEQDERGLFDTMMHGIEILERVAAHDRESTAHRLTIEGLRAQGMQEYCMAYKGLPLSVYALFENGKLAPNTKVHIFLGNHEITHIAGVELLDHVIYEVTR